MIVQIKGKITQIIKHIIIVLLMITFAAGSAFAASPNTVCAEVKLLIEQKYSFERQAFDAKMVISNGLTDNTLKDVNIELFFTDINDNVVLSSSDQNTSDALFFYRINSMEGINSLDGKGLVEPSSKAEIHWLIIPTTGAAKHSSAGAIYQVGAKVTYTLNDITNTIDIAPDYIVVRPLPELTLDYFLPKEVYGDDPFTKEEEESIPFSLGVRVKNDGLGVAKNSKIDSANVKIIENKQGLSIDFNIWSSYVNDKHINKSLLLTLGDISPQSSVVGRWLMTTSLSGHFSEFDTTVTHADELGGTLTSVIKKINTHTLVRDIKIDLPGRDNIRDFLAYDVDVLRVYESEGIDSEVNDQSKLAQLKTTNKISQLTFPATDGFVFVKLKDPWKGKGTALKVIRSDGTLLLPENAWLSKERTEDLSWDYFINVFDINSDGIYAVEYEQKQQKTISITGKLLDTEIDNKPIGGVTIRLYDPLTYVIKQTTVTALDGTFSFHDLKEANYAVEAVTSTLAINSTTLRAETAALIHPDRTIPGLIKYVTVDTLNMLILNDDGQIELQRMDGTTHQVTNLSDMVNLSHVANEKRIYVRLPETAGFFYIKKAISWAEWLPLNKLYLPGGDRVLPQENIWISKTKEIDGTYSYYINIFGYDKVNYYYFDFPNDLIVGQVFNDVNNNKIQDNWEHNVTNAAIEYIGSSIDGFYYNQFAEYTDNKGTFLTGVDAGNYQLKVRESTIRLEAKTTSTKYKVDVITEGKLP